MYARTQNQRNGRGQAVALDLVRAVLRAENMMTAIRHNEAMRARLSEDFGGYLVTDGEAGYPFRSSRDIYVSRLGYDYTTTSGSWVVSSPNVRYDDEAGGAIDAPKWIAAGCMSSRCSEFLGMAVLRAGA